MSRATILAAATFAASASAAAQIPTLRAVPDQRYGSLDGAAALGFVTDAVVLADGTVVVADAREPSLKVFDAGGGFLRAIGGKGEASGEFDRISGVGLLADTIWVADMGAFRQTLFDVDGDVLAERRVASRPTQDRPRPQLALLLAGGRAIAPPAMPEYPTGDPTMPLLLLDYAGTALDTVAWLRIGTTSLNLTAPDGGAIAISGGQVFLSDPLWAADPAGHGAVSVVQGLPLLGDSAGFVIDWTAADGSSGFSRTIRYIPTRITTEHIAAAIADMTRGDLWVDRFGGRAALEAAIRDQLVVPDYLPGVSDLVAGRDGTIWLKRTGRWATGDARWTVLDAEGAIIADVLMPYGADILAAQRDTVWAFIADEAGVSVVVRYRIE